MYAEQSLLSSSLLPPWQGLGFVIHSHLSDIYARYDELLHAPGGWKEEKGGNKRTKVEFRVSVDVSPRWFLQRFLKQQKKYEHLSRHFTEPVCVMSSPSLKSVRTCNRRRHISGPHYLYLGTPGRCKQHLFVHKLTRHLTLFLLVLPEFDGEPGNSYGYFQ